MWPWQQWKEALEQIRRQALGEPPEPQAPESANSRLDDVARQAAAYLTLLYTLPANQVYRLKLLARRVEAGLVSEWI